MNQKLKDYELLEAIGRGSFGVVYRAKRKSDSRICVVKQIDIKGMSSEQQKETIQEVNILASLDNIYVIKYYDSFVTTSDSKLNIVMEYAAHGTLYSKLSAQKGKKMAENIIWRYFIQIVCGLFYIHKKRILHRDIKTMNIFLDGVDNVKIGDFGVSKVLDHTRAMANTLVGTPYYLSPELCEDKPYGDKSDIWALGCILYELCTFKHPFDANNQGALILKIIQGAYAPIGTSFYSPDMSKIVKWCLTKETKQRPSAAQLLLNDFIFRKSKELGISLPSEILAEYSNRQILPPIEKQLPPVGEVRKSAVSQSSPAQAPISQPRPSSAGAKKLVKAQKQPSPVVAKAIPESNVSNKPQIVRSPLFANNVNNKPSPLPANNANLKPKKSARELEIEEVRNLPTVVIPKKDPSPNENPKSSREPSPKPMTSPVAPVESPVETEPEQESVELPPPREIRVATPKLEHLIQQSPELHSLHIDLQPQIERITIEDDEDDEAMVTWRVIDKSIDEDVEVEGEPSDSPCEATITLPGVNIKHKNSKAREINRLFDKQEPLKERIQEIKKSMESRVSKQKVDEIIEFMKKIDGADELEKQEQITKFVFGRIAYSDADLLDCFNDIMSMERQLITIEKEIALLTQLEESKEPNL